MTGKARNNWQPREPRPPEYWRNRVIVLRGSPPCVIRIEGICTGKAKEADHIVPVSDGGSHKIENLRPACPECNAELNYRNRPKPPPRTLRRKPEPHPGRID